jgi:hypothetical protein
VARPTIPPPIITYWYFMKLKSGCEDSRKSESGRIVLNKGALLLGLN